MERKKSLFPLWSKETLLKKDIESPSTHWLEPVQSLGFENSKDAQFDMPITRKAFVFHCVDSTFPIPFPDPKIDRDLLNFYVSFYQPQYLTWSNQKITTVKLLKPTSAGKFISVKFKVTQGSSD